MQQAHAREHLFVTRREQCVEESRYSFDPEDLDDLRRFISWLSVRKALLRPPKELTCDFATKPAPSHLHNSTLILETELGPPLDAGFLWGILNIFLQVFLHREPVLEMENRYLSVDSDIDKTLAQVEKLVQFEGLTLAIHQSRFIPRIPSQNLSVAHSAWLLISDNISTSDTLVNFCLVSNRGHVIYALTSSCFCFGKRSARIWEKKAYRRTSSPED
ncbi:hypothetical protein S7711_10752 [Stachybotrys chartarum IBT 7711]|uniref:Uncharacterized protein n=1 Tax=Stachybotrys chartarum (strain CBS 109288 / IBT 7711) TaxID=1280523 RepID=A0A084B7L5_STACB|nr:hypothetical protein S7711_10752 [Stachybotrys chartarum IBT 7711]